MMKIFKQSDLNDYELIVDNFYNYSDNKYSMNYLIKKDNIINSILIQSPKLQLQSNLNTGYMVLYLYNNKNNEKYCNFIKDIENNVDKIIKTKLKKKLKLHSNNIDGKMILNINNQKYSIFDNNNNLINCNDVEIYSNVICILKLKNIWIDLNKKKYGLNWIVYQIKVYPELNYNVCYIDDSDDESNDKKIVNE